MSQSNPPRVLRSSLVKRGSDGVYPYRSGGEVSPAMVGNYGHGSDTDSTMSISSTSSEDSLSKLMETSRISDFDEDYTQRNNNYYQERRKSYSVPWKTQLQVSQSGRMKEKKHLRSQRNSIVIDNELFTPLERNTCTKENRTVRFAV